MEQMTLFELPFKYMIDTSSILSQKPGEPHTRQVYKGQWEKIEQLMKEQVIITCSEVSEEIKDKPIKDWLSAQHCHVAEIDNTVQENVRRIVTDNPKMIEFTGKSGTSSGDAFLIATAMKYKLTVITEENPDKQNKIPQICKRYGIEAIDITKLCEREGWTF